MNKKKFYKALGTAIIIIFIFLITFITLSIFQIANYHIEISTEPTQTQIVKSNPSHEEVQLRPSITSDVTLTKEPTLEILLITKSTPTITPSQVVTDEMTYPTDVPISPTQQPTEIVQTPTPLPPQPTETIETPLPLPTATQKTTVSCGVNPSTIPGGTLSTQLYWAQFTPAQAGLGISSITFDINGSGQRSCSAASDNSGYASCEGSAGVLPFSKKITVTISTSVGNCVTNINTN
jgi:hypothetical protein